MRAFHDDPAIKERYLARVRDHAAADEIIHGTYWHDGKGCAVGCTVHSGDHAAYESELGIPQAIARLEDRIFEGLDNGEAQSFPMAFLAAIPVGADLALVVPRFLHWLLVDETDGVLRFATGRGAKSIEHVAGLYRRLIDGEAIAPCEWQDARSVAAHAYAAAAAHAYAHAYAAAAAHAYAHADAAYADAHAYADAAYAAYAAATPLSHAYSRMKAKLLALLDEAPGASRE